MQKFQLQTTNNNTATIAHGGSSEQRSRQTSSSVTDSEIVGRIEDKNKIVDILTKENTASSSSSSSDVNYHSLEKVSIVSIVGMDGLGKTTLAQLVYNDQWVIKHFDQRIWVCVSTDFDVENVLIKIMESITLSKFDNVLSFDLLVKKVEEKLQGKKFLLVLDDLWNENTQQWERLKSPLLFGAQGSKVLITTRNMRVADVVKGSIRPYQLEKLHEDECWSIMEKRAFSPGGAVKTPNMTKVGKEIAKKFSGLPLAAKFLGSLMHSKKKESDWLSIKETDIWNTQEGQSEIRPILKLSYDNLSPHLKQCFSYCSIFPKGWEIKRELLIRLWLAEGFLGPSSNTVGNAPTFEDIGREYFDSLVRSSFLDGVETGLINGTYTFKMHDLVHDLGRDVTGDREFAISKPSELETISDIRRLQLILDDDLSTTRPKGLSELKKLRTIFVLEPSSNMKAYSFSSNEKLRVLHFGRLADGCRDIRYPTANEWRHLRYFHVINLNLMNDPSICKLYNLQTLVLSECVNVQNLLQNIGSLRNLRFLGLSSSDIKELPDSVTSLCNLQTLDLSHCKSLITFPNSITGLKQLKILDMSFTPIEELPGFIINLHNLQKLYVDSCEKLKCLPEFVAGLTNLSKFDFKNCRLLKALPEDFGALTQLRYLSLDGTQIKVLPESCANLYNLETLDIFWCELPKDVTNWMKLKQFNYKKSGTPMGIGRLVWLQLLVYEVRGKVVNDSELLCNDGIEELANLNYLERLSIANLQNVKDPIDAERANLKGKQNLHELYLIWGETEEELGRMRIEEQKSCNHLQVIEALQPPSGLKTLCIRYFMGWDLPTWMCVSSGFPKLEVLELKNCKGIKQLPAAIGQFPRLKRLHLTGLLSLKSLDIGGFPSLTDLILTDMFLLEELGYPYPPRLQNLGITGCKSLTEIASFPSLVWLELEKVSHKLLCSVGTGQTTLTKLLLENIEDLIYFPISILQNNCNLHILQIKECNQFEGFRVNDDENENVVQILRIKECNQLQGIGVNDKGSEIFSGSIHELYFMYCPLLKFLPDLRGWTSLQKLGILKCPQVKESLTYDLKSLSFLEELYVDFIQKDEKRGDPSFRDDMINLMKK